MAKCIVLGEVNIPEPKKKPIELVSYIDGKGHRFSANISRWNNYELIAANYKCEKLDLIFCYEGDRANGALYLGYWNDGIV